MRDYNLLTLQLLYEGATAEKHPDFVKVGSSQLTGNNPLNNLGGGFEYTREYLRQMVFKTPCGCYVKGGNVLDNMSFHIDWMPENNNPVIRCPLSGSRDFSCEKMHPLLRPKIGHSDVNGMQFCSCYRTDEPYDYELSIERLRKARDDMKEKRYQEFVRSKNGHVCRNHARYNEREEKWEMHYSPEMCAHQCYSEYCPIRGRELDKKKGDVYYDVYKSGVYEDGFLIQEWCRAEKGLRYFKKPVSMDICRDLLKNGDAEKIIKQEVLNNSTRQLLFDKSLKIEIRNIRAESRPSRDLMQDLEDIKNGYYVSWNPEEEKKAKADKKARRAEAARKRAEKLRKKIIRDGYENLEAVECMRAEKLFSKDEILEMKRLHEKEMEKPVLEQIDLFAYL